MREEAQNQPGKRIPRTQSARVKNRELSASRLVSDNRDQHSFRARASDGMLMRLIEGDVFW